MRVAVQVIARTVDTCGAGGVSGLLEARRMVLHEGTPCCLLRHTLLSHHHTDAVPKRS